MLMLQVETALDDDERACGLASSQITGHLISLEVAEQAAAGEPAAPSIPTERLGTGRGIVPSLCTASDRATMSTSGTLEMGQPLPGRAPAARAEVIERYERWLLTQPELLAAVPGLAGRALGCWCAPAHATTSWPGSRPRPTNDAADVTGREALRRRRPLHQRQPCHRAREQARQSAPTDTGGRSYAGIGSRRTPPAMFAMCEQMARALAARGWRLRSGHAPSADRAFEQGAAGDADIFRPWPAFENSTPVLGCASSQSAPAAFDLAREHPRTGQHWGEADEPPTPATATRFSAGHSRTPRAS